MMEAIKFEMFKKGDTIFFEEMARFLVPISHYIIVKTSFEKHIGFMVNFDSSAKNVASSNELTLGNVKILVKGKEKTYGCIGAICFPRILLTEKTFFKS